MPITELEVEAIANRCIEKRSFQSEEIDTIDSLMQKNIEPINVRLTGIDARLKAVDEMKEFMIQEKAKKAWVQDLRSAAVAMATVASALFAYSKL